MATRTGLTGSFWPTENQILLLRAALLEDERGREAWRLLEHDFDVTRAEEGSMALLPLLYEELSKRNEHDSSVSRLKGVYRYLWYRDQVGLRVLRECLAILDHAGVEATLLGDAALLLRYYRRLGVRTLDEVTVMVSPEVLESAVRAVTSEGWTRTGVSHGAVRFSASSSENAPQCALSVRPSLELEAAPGLAQRIWQARQQIDEMEIRSSTLSATHELLRTCLRAGRGGSETQWVVDAATILRRAPEVDWQEIVAAAQQTGCASRLGDSFSFLVDVLEAPIPEDVTARLDAIQSTRRERLAQRISGRGGHLAGNLPVAIASHVVARQRESIFRTMITLPRFLGAEWGLDHMGQLPGAFARRGASAITSRLKRKLLERRWKADGRLRRTTAEEHAAGSRELSTDQEAGR